MKKVLFLIMVCFSMHTMAAYQYTIDNAGFNITHRTGVELQFTDNSFFRDYQTLGIVTNGKETVYNTADANGKKFELGPFEAGQSFSMYVTQNGNRFDGVRMTDLDNGHFTWLIDNGISFDVKVNLYEGNNNTAPSGQPLPGVLGCLLLGGGTMSTCRFFKKRKAVKE